MLIDLQGAFLAPPEYDLVCLLRDSYVDLDDAEVEAQAERVRSALPDAPNRDDFARRFDLLTISRKGKDLARFIQAATERGDERFLTYVPRTLRVVRDAANGRRSATHASPTLPNSAARSREQHARNDRRRGSGHTAAPAVGAAPEARDAGAGHPADRVPARPAVALRCHRDRDQRPPPARRTAETLRSATSHRA